MKKLFLLILPILFLSACKTLVPYNKQLKEKYSWTESEIKQIQFYLSNPITLQRRLSNSSTEIVSGKIKTQNGEQIEEIYIKKGTPGILVADKGNKGYKISFEIDDNHTLTFGWFENKGSNYYLKADEFKKGKFYKVNYNGKTYNTNLSSLQSFLLINMKKIQKEERKQRVAGGRKI